MTVRDLIKKLADAELDHDVLILVPYAEGGAEVRFELDIKSVQIRDHHHYVSVVTEEASR